MPWPVKGMPIIEPLNSSTITRPSRAIDRVTVPVDSDGGAAGSGQFRTLAS